MEKVFRISENPEWSVEGSNEWHSFNETAPVKSNASSYHLSRSCHCMALVQISDNIWRCTHCNNHFEKVFRKVTDMRSIQHLL